MEIYELIRLFSNFKIIIYFILFKLVVIILFMGDSGYPRSVLLIYFMVKCFLLLLKSFWFESITLTLIEFNNIQLNKPLKKIIIIGAGRAGEKIAREIISSRNSTYKIMGFIDDNYEKDWKEYMVFQILCDVKGLINIKIDYDELLIADSLRESNSNTKILDLYVKELVRHIKLFRH